MTRAGSQGVLPRYSASIHAPTSTTATAPPPTRASHAPRRRRRCASASAMDTSDAVAAPRVSWCWSDGPLSPRYQGRFVMKSGLCGLIMAPLFTSTSGAAWPF